MDLTIRDYKPEDFEQVDKLWNDTGMGGAERGDDRKTIDETLNHGGRLFILEDKTTSKIIGTSWLTNDGRRIYLHHFGISPEHQGKGYSKDLLNKSLEFAESAGKQIKLEVHNIRNKRAVNLYRKFGFRYLGDYDVYIIRDYNTSF